METIGRKEDMSPDGDLLIHRQEDGDFVVTVRQGDPDGGIEQVASCEFTTPMAGGGGSPETWKALAELFDAMKRDHENGSASRRSMIVE